MSNELLPKVNFEKLVQAEEELDNMQERVRQQREDTVTSFFEAVLAFDEEDFPYHLDLLFSRNGTHDARWEIGKLHRCWRQVYDMYQYELNRENTEWSIIRNNDGDYTVNSVVHYSNDCDYRTVTIPAFFVDNDFIQAHEHVAKLLDEARRCEHEEKMRHRNKTEARERELLAVLSAKYGM